ncbi:arylsulfatase [Cyclobacterium qasimii]|uniref:Arylsulfatase n=2 Tax=Cyclobacterium qasimii TaxID=1350429 RepID=S7VH51_9BACT|nr:arylsulfatase [Cyclobacterium qasimii]EPR68857.1 Arylsulfatase [Cyclobacterium qasimii M12-11B]GEO22583.1 sulfatase [Cyclobacterium qasimii]
MQVNYRPIVNVFLLFMALISGLFTENVFSQQAPNKKTPGGLIDDIPTNKAKVPNIVLIFADDLGWSDLGCYGGEIPTPNLDALAADGLRFTQFYNNSVCGPSRASLLTGLYAQRIGHTGTNWNEPTDYSRSINLGEGLQMAGYHTMMVGKWQDPDMPTKRGFDRFYGPMCAGKISYFDEVEPNPFFLNESKVELPDDFYLTDDLTDYALEFLKESELQAATDKKPFFLYVSHIAPHWPLHANEADIVPHRSRYREEGWNGWSIKRLEKQTELGLIPQNWPINPRPDNDDDWTMDSLKNWEAERMAVYAAQVASIDQSTGRIVDMLKKSGQFENTLILFLSDNGAAPDGGEKPTTNGFFGQNESGTWRLNGEAVQLGSGPDNLPGPADSFQAYGLDWALMSNTPFRSTKMTGYEGGIRTPLIAHWPKGIQARGEIVNDVGHIIDLMPTFLELANGTYPSELEGRKPLPLDGQSLSPIFQGKKLSPPDFLAWRVPENRVLRSGDWKIISEDENSPWELYNLAADGTETTNLANNYPEKVKNLVGKWELWVESCKNQ